ncbi:TetR/AcrR family transcriptional regulator [Bifidobacterium primatium]|nr:TetR family transcriptional regulator [Bifidobacterium primatium]
MSKFDSKLDVILDAATELISKYGFYGTSLERVAEQTGMSKQNLLYYVKNKNNLMTLVIRDRYDDTPEMIERFNAHKTGDPHYIGPLTLPEYYRIIAEVNAKRPVFVKLFTVINAEALEPSHPAHDYFTHRDEMTRERIRSGIDWKLPPGVDLWQAVRICDSTMDGMQIKWLRDTSVPLTELWAGCEEMLFPSPIWDGYR